MCQNEPTKQVKIFVVNICLSDTYNDSGEPGFAPFPVHRLVLIFAEIVCY